MTHKQRILAACRGETPEKIPWVPRLDLWYNAHLRAGTLPEPYRGRTLRQITDALGVGYHAVVPNFLEASSPDDCIDRCLGIYRVKEMPFETRLRGVQRKVDFVGDVTRVRYHTPVGAVSCAFSYTEEMKQAGASISWVQEHPFKSPEDYPVLEYIFSNLEVVPSYERYRRWQEWVGEAGVAVALCDFAASPMQHIMRDLMPLTDFFLEMHDHPDRMHALAASMEGWYEQMLRAAAESPAEIIFLGGNYDETITYPPFFEQHLLPWLAKAAEIFHARAKLLLTHTDGENAGLMHLYRRCNFDIADSICPAPMTKLSLAECIEQLPGVTIWGGIPSIALCPDSMSDDEFDRLIDETIDLATGKSHLILGIADTTPPTASFERILRITQRING